jgi:uncharacterized protein with FMN-binding domain
VRKRAVAASILSSAAVLVVGWQLGAPSAVMTSVPSASSGVGTSTGPGSPATGTSSTGTSSAGTPSAGGASAPAATASATPAAPAAASGTFVGTSTSTRFGSVQVQITVTAGSITDVTALKLTDADGRSVQISNRAAPVLRQEVLSAQSAQVSTVSGATYTSEAYLTSLQSALDQAGL